MRFAPRSWFRRERGRAADRPPLARVLFLAADGPGAGHLARPLAVARRLGPGLQPVILTGSPRAASTPLAHGIIAEHPFPAADPAGDDPDRPGRRAIGARVAFYRPAVVVFDGPAPGLGLIGALIDHPSAWAVWLRGGLRRPDADAAPLGRGRAFDLVVEPGELAAVLDKGPTRRLRAEAAATPPIRVHDGRDMPDRAAARVELGLPAEGTVLLLRLGSTDQAARAAERASVLARARGLHAVRAEASEAGRPFPFGRHLNAFDAALCGAGYDDAHEVLLDGPPAALLPDPAGEDDQATRARHAERHGLALRLRPEREGHVEACLDRLLDPVAAAAMRRARAALDRTNGADAMARLVARLAALPRPREAGRAAVAARRAAEA